MRLTPLKLVHISLVSLLLMLSGCFQQKSEPTQAGDNALFDDNSLRNARPISISGENELLGQDFNSETPVTELPYNEIEADSELSAQAVLAGVKGFVALYRKNTAGTYEIRVYNQTNNAATTVYSGTQEVQSVAVNVTGNLVVASMKNPANNKFDVYLFQIGNPTPFLLTNTATLDESNVSMTRTGNKIAWEGRISSTNPTIRPYVCALSSTFSCTVSFLTSSFDQIQPSLSANGLYVALVRVITNPTRYAVLRYTFATNSYTFVSTIAAPDIYADPSIDDTGSKVMFSRTSNNAHYILIRNLLANTVVTELGSTSSVSHPFITADGKFVAYSQLNPSTTPNRLQVRTRDLAYNAVAIQEAGSWDYFQSFWMVPPACGSGTTEMGDQFLTTQEDVNRLDGVSKITGSLIINPTSTSLDLSPLALLTEVTGSFTLSSNAIQTTLAGFECLTSVGSTFTINDNTVLTSISGFAALNSVGGGFFIGFNSLLASVSGFNTLSTIGSHLEIASNPALTSITNFNVLKSVGTDFSISSNANLTSINGFFALNSVGVDFSISSNNSLTRISDFSTLNSVGGEFVISFNSVLTSIPQFSALTSVGINFSISNNAALTGIFGFAALKLVGGQFVISNHASIRFISSFVALTSVEGNLSIINNADLTYIFGFSVLTSVGGNFSISSNADLTSISGFNLLESGRIAGTATVSNNPQFNCQNPDPHFSPLDVSINNSINCFTDIAIVGFAWVDQPATASYTPDTTRSYNITGGSITANRTTTGTYNIGFAGLTLNSYSNVQITAFNDIGSNQDNYCNVFSVSGSTVNVRCFDASTNALVDSRYNIAITDKTTGSTAKVSAYVLANDSTSASYTPVTTTSYNGYAGGAITATRSTTGTYTVSFVNGDFEADSNIQVTALDERAYCRSDGWSGTDAFVFCFDATGAAIDSRFLLAVIDATPPVGTTTKIVGYAFANQSNVASYTPNPVFAYNQTGFGVSATRTAAGIYRTIFTNLDLSTNYHVQVTAQTTNPNYCVLGSLGPIFGIGDDVLATCYDSAGTKTNTTFSIWVVQK
jgi:hypothetical protein